MTLKLILQSAEYPDLNFDWRKLQSGKYLKQQAIFEAKFLKG